MSIIQLLQHEDERVIYFDHKRKTGGIFIRDVMRRYFNHVCLYHEVFKDLSVNPGAGVEFMSAHFLFEKLHRNPGDFYFTMARHPVKKVYSDYWFHVKMITKTPDHPAVFGWNDTERAISQMTPEEYVNWILSEPNIPWWLDTKRDYETLMEDNHYDFIGVCEDMFYTLVILSYYTGTHLTQEEHARKANTSTPEGFEYKYKELCELFTPQINRYEEICQILKHKWTACVAREMLYKLTNTSSYTPTITPTMRKAPWMLSWTSEETRLTKDYE